MSALPRPKFNPEFVQALCEKLNLGLRDWYYALAGKIGKPKVGQDESYDRIVRDQDELDDKLHYMLNNPVKKELCEDPWGYVGWYFKERADEERADKNVCPTITITPEEQEREGGLG